MSTPRKIGDNERQKPKIFLKCGEGERLEVCRLCLPFIVSAGAGGRGFRCFRTCRRLALVIWSCAPCLLSALLLCSWCIACRYALISRFKGVFSVVWGLRVGLCCLGALRGLCGFCARVELGGLKTFCVFASLLSSLLSSFLSSFLFSCSYVCILLCSLSFFALVVFICSLALSLLFPFPFRYIRKKKGRAVLVRPLLVCRGLLSFSLSVMQNKVFRPRKIHNRWPRFLRLYIRLSKYIRNHSATA